jgi:hypothetical protein
MSFSGIGCSEVVLHVTFIRLYWRARRVLVLPFRLQDLPLILIVLHDGARPDYGKHSSVGQVHESVNAVAKVQMLDESNRNFSPNLSQFRKKIGFVQLELFGRFHRYDDRVVRLCDTGSQLRLCRRKHGLIPAEVADVAAERREDAGPMDVVDRTHAIKTNIGDLLNALIQIERRPGRRFISEVVEINSYDPDADLFDFCTIYAAPREHA